VNLRTLLAERLEAALRDAGAADAPAIVGPATRPEFGDYQANGALAAAKRLGMQPRDLAAQVVEVADLSGIAASCAVTGPGFISLTITDDCLSEALADGRIEPVGGGERVVIDYSHPNLAKEMQVHHLRSTIIGDAVARVLDALGYDVIRQNHVGDWGTGFGRLVAHLNDIGEDSDALGDLERFYAEASERFANDATFADRARQVVVDLQGGDPGTLERWRRYIDISMSHCQTVYDRLGVGLKPEHIRGESAYNDDLDGIVEDLQAKGLLTESDGALCAFLPEFKGKDGKTVPIIVRKSDGGYLYHSTDLAAVRYRTRDLHAKRVLYVVDARQSLHFKQLFALAKRAAYDAGASLEHHPFGMMLDNDGRPFKTREGSGTRLIDFLDDATVRARRLVEAKNPELDAKEMDRVACAVGIGAVKYADLSKNRTGDYVFAWDAMMSFEGNTAPYLQYAYARIQSLFERGQVAPASLEGKPAIREPEEHVLALQLARFQETLEQVAATVMPHHLCTYLYDLAVNFMRFYERCPVLDSDVRNDRLLLCRHTAATLSRGLDLLGIETVDRM